MGMLAASEIASEYLPLTISLISITVAIIGASPLLIQFFVYRFLDPKFDVYLSIQGKDHEKSIRVNENDRYPWWKLSRSELTERSPEDAINVPTITMNNSENDLDIHVDRIELRVNNDRFWTVANDLEQYVRKIGPKRYFIKLSRVDAEALEIFPSDPKGGNRITETGFFPSNRVHTFGLPIEPRFFRPDEIPERLELDVILHLSVNPEDVNFRVYGPLPRFLGRISLKPVKISHIFKGE